jgi:uncharacterized membrane protein YesL
MERQIPLALRFMHKYKKEWPGGELPGFSLLLHQYFFYTNAALLDRAILGLAPIFIQSFLSAFESSCIRKPYRNKYRSYLAQFLG